MSVAHPSAAELEAWPKSASSIVPPRSISGRSLIAVVAIMTFLAALTGGGVRYAFESVGSEKVLAQAYQATRRGGTTVTMGLPHPSKQFTVPAVSLVAEERVLMGSYMGSAVPRRDIPRFLAMYKAGLLPVDKLHTHTIALDAINPAFDTLAQGLAVRQLIQLA